MTKLVFQDFCQETTAHGFLRIGDPNRRWSARLLWIFVMLSFTAVFSWQAKLLVERYLRYETNVNTELTTEEELTFPTITLCNVNPYQKDRLPHGSGIDRYLTLVENITRMEYMMEMKDMCQSEDPVVLLLCANTGLIDSSNNSTSAGTRTIAPKSSATALADDGATTAASAATSTAIATTVTQQSDDEHGPGNGVATWQRGNGQDFRDRWSENGSGSLISNESFGSQFGQPPPDGQQPNRHQGPKVSWLMMENKAFKDIGTLAAAMNPDGYDDALQPESDFIQDCRFNAASCAGIRRDRHPWYGACYSFNPLGNHTSVRPGPLYGLAVQLHVNSSQYLRSTFVIGVRIGVDQAYRSPFPEINGVFAPVGASTAISVAVVETDRKGPPYGDCLKDGGQLHGTDTHYYQTNYTLNGCLNTCLQRQIVKHCGCWSFAYPEPPGNSSTVPLCATASQSMCATAQEMSTAKNCCCKPMCNDLDYRLTVSHSVWPAQKQKRCPPGPMCSNSDPSGYAKENQLKLQIYFDSLTKYAYTESEAYTFLSLISDFGGQLGLWIGASFCTMIEVLSFVVSLITVCFGCTNADSVEKRLSKDQSKRAYESETAKGSDRPRSASFPPKRAVYPKVTDVYG